MIENSKQQAKTRMTKCIDGLRDAFSKIRTGRAHPSLLDHIHVDYYGSNMPLSKVANIATQDSRTLTITPWDKNMVGPIEKAILQSDLGLNPSTAGMLIRVPLPALTEERRKDLIKVVKQEAEHARVAVRAVRRDANTEIKALLKEKKISEDDERRAEEEIQKLTDQFIAQVDKMLAEKEKDMMQV